MTDPLPSDKPERLMSLDAFRGLTILGMIFVIAIAAGQYQKESVPLPLTQSWFGSLPISTWFHAETGYDLWQSRESLRLRESGLDEKQIQAAIAAAPETARKNIGLTVTDLVAPWFVFIVGVCIPLSRQTRETDWAGPVLRRTGLLVLVGVVYMSLVIKQVTWWWGVLQAIGIAYLCGALLFKAAPQHRGWIVFAVAGGNLLMTALFPWWTGAWENVTAPFGTLSNPSGSWVKPWIVHCQPWLSISYGVMTMIGVLVGQVIPTGDSHRILRRCFCVGVLFTSLGYLIHAIGWQTGQWHLCMSKPDVTTSYAFFAAGLGALCFGLFYYVVDVRKIRGWIFPLVVFGGNPLLAYFLQIILRRLFESLGLIGAFNRVNPDNTFVQNWAVLFGSPGFPSPWVLDFFSKGGWMGVMWGLLWTACLWACVLFCNRRGWYWKL
ncbi:MAG: hypothetical protein SFY92_00405 [Verrucomicrobiae bacterium]|nr:hypothetical protein [Verrucomicrobiae bacterium]